MISFLNLIGIATLSLLFLFIGLTVGFVSSRNNRLATLGVGLFLGSLMWLLSLLFPSVLLSIPFFPDFLVALNSLVGSPLILNSELLTAVLVLIFLLESGCVIGFITARKSSPLLVQDMVPIAAPNLTIPGNEFGRTVISDNSMSHNVRRASISRRETNVQSQVSGLSNQSALQAQFITRRSNPPQISANPTEDERTLATLFVTGRIKEVLPKLDDSTKDGYYYEQLQHLGWDIPRQTAALTSLAARGYLNPSPIEKVLRCTQCGSMRLQLRSECPECGSPRTQKHKVLEHFSCGMIDKEQNFRGEQGELVCPKCNKSLEVIGLDYRSLGSMYACLQCGALSKEPSTLVKCSRCGHSAKPEEEIEDYLLSYSINGAMLSKMKQLVKPVKAISSHFEEEGFAVFSPAMVKGRSGTEHSFDMLLLTRGTKSHSIQMAQPKGHARPDFNRQDDKKLVLEIQSSGGPIKLDELSGVFGKLNDIVYDSLLVAIPSLDEAARDYAKTYGISTIEGETTENVIPKIANFIAPKLV